MRPKNKYFNSKRNIFNEGTKLVMKIKYRNSIIQNFCTKTKLKKLIKTNRLVYLLIGEI